jgi:TonB family protein
MRNSILFPAICFIMAAPALAIDPPEYPLEQADVFDDPATDPKPEGNPGEWVTPMDYPSAALREELEGAVGFRLIVDQNGKPSNCLITSSSGYGLLDDGACNSLMKRGKFTPATDKGGRPVVGAWNSSVRWQIPQNTIISIPPSEFWTVTYVVEEDGRVSSCKMEKAEGQAEFYDFCGQLPSFYPGTDESGEPVRKKIRILHRVVHEDVQQ